MKKPTNEVDKSGVSVVFANSHCKEEVVWQCATEISMIASIFLSLSHCPLDTFATGKHVNHGGKYGLETPKIFIFWT